MTAEPKKYATATAFRRALEDRLLRRAKEGGGDVQRLRREVAFDRLLARLFAAKKAPWVLKGGYAMELRFAGARATKDVDLALRESLGKGRGDSLNAAIHEALIEAASKDLEDFFSFIVAAPVMDLDAAPYGGARFPIEARMDGRTFVKFQLDVGAGDVVLEPLDETVGRDWLDFASIPAPRYPTVSREQQFAEKIHAYTLPRERPNTRVKDLVDLFLLLKSGTLDAGRVGPAVRATFERRKTHPLPDDLSQPPAAWKVPFQTLAAECGLAVDVEAAFALVGDYYRGIRR
ncbi:MAG: nucleotidyl transferase AbiEii/AbiGii toxin family protein [Elusimicrobiota bacterium]|nr:nucleotidyl transferase AbiEii/AbiGii toxin family protein [Elusimicrobiota bacterium]